MTTDPVGQFIARWKNSGAAERANYQLFLIELSEILGVPKPSPALPDNEANAYVFERSVEFILDDGSTSGFIDLYKRGCFVLEAKQGSDAPAGRKPAFRDRRQRPAQAQERDGRRGTRAWDDAMLRAKARPNSTSAPCPPPKAARRSSSSSTSATRSRCTPNSAAPAASTRPSRPPAVTASSSTSSNARTSASGWPGSGPRPTSSTPPAAAPRRPARSPPASRASPISLEQSGHDPHAVATFLMRCLFTMFAEDVGLLAAGVFTRLLDSLRDRPEHFAPMVEEVWGRMNTGGFSTGLRTAVLQFNGGLFEDSSALPLDRDQLLLLLEASRSDWRDVEPAIFGTLLERALDPVERHKLGAHYTPRAYVERLVLPTIVEPCGPSGTPSRPPPCTSPTPATSTRPIRQVKAFHQHLSNVRILDPACGTGNFLYVTLEHLKRLEGEIYDLLRQFGDTQAMFELRGYTVDPHQLLGLEINPRAAAIAELVLWIGTCSGTSARAATSTRPSRSSATSTTSSTATPCSRTTGPSRRSTTRAARSPAGTAEPPSRTRSPEGKSPTKTPASPSCATSTPAKPNGPRRISSSGIRRLWGRSRCASPSGTVMPRQSGESIADVPESCDFVMYWWNHAAELVASGEVRRFGFVTTNSIRQKFNRRVLDRHLEAKL